MLMEYLKMKLTLSLFSGISVFVILSIFTIFYALLLKLRKRKKGNE